MALSRPPRARRRLRPDGGWIARRGRPARKHRRGSWRHWRRRVRATSAFPSCRRRPDRPRAMRSMASPEFNSTPEPNSAPEATVWTAGMARPSAQGQVMMSTAIAVTTASCKVRQRSASRPSSIARPHARPAHRAARRARRAEDNASATARHSRAGGRSRPTASLPTPPLPGPATYPIAPACRQRPRCRAPPVAGSVSPVIRL